MLDATTDLKSLLKDPSLLETRAYVNGAFVDGEGTFEVTNPARGDVIAQVADVSRMQAREAIKAANTAQKDWAKWTGKERAGVLRKWFDLMMVNQEDLAVILTAEMGKPLAESRGEIAYGASFIEFFAEEAKRIYGETIPGHQRDKRITVIKQPIGVAASITPWNFPNAMITRKAGPALAAGCAFVARPASETPLSATALAVLAERASLPAGCVQRHSGLGCGGHRQGVLREPHREEADLHRLHQRRTHPAAAGGGSGDEMLHGAGWQRAFHRL